MADATCSVADCPRPVRTRELCNPHYQRLKIDGDVQADKPIRGRRPPPLLGATCSIDTCDRIPDSRGWCDMHYRRWCRTGVAEGWQDPGCSFDGCDRPHYGGPGKWCRLHYRRWRTHGDPSVVVQPSQRLPQPFKPCTVVGCDKRYAGKGLCRKHYQASWIRNNPARHRRWLRKYRRANREKARLASELRRARWAGVLVKDLTAEQWRDIKIAYRHRCAYCHKRRPLTMDHVIPLTRNGHHTASNILPACRRCNSKKNNRPAPLHQPLLF